MFISCYYIYFKLKKFFYFFYFYNFIDWRIKDGCPIKKIWEQTLNIIKGEMSEVSFNTWIKSCEPISIDDTTLKLSVPNDFTKDILEQRYKSLLVQALKIVSSKKYNIDFLLQSEFENTETSEVKKEERL